MDCKYLFPFELIPQNAIILIYGVGELGQAYFKQILLTKYCRVLGFVDRNYKDYIWLEVPVFSPAEIFDLDFDYIVLAFRAGDFALDVKQTLIRGGINKDKLIFIGIRNDIIRVADDSIISDEDVRYAYEKRCFSIR